MRSQVNHDNIAIQRFIFKNNASFLQIEEGGEGGRKLILMVTLLSAYLKTVHHFYKLKEEEKVAS